MRPPKLISTSIYIPGLKATITTAIDAAKLLGSRDVQLKLTFEEAKALRQSLNRAAGSVRGIDGENHPTISFITVSTEED